MVTKYFDMQGSFSKPVQFKITGLVEGKSNLVIPEHQDNKIGSGKILCSNFVTYVRPVNFQDPNEE